MSRIRNVVNKIARPVEKHYPVFLNKLMNMCFAILGSFYYSKLKRKYPGYTFLITFTRSAGDIMFLRLMLNNLLEHCKIDKYIFIIDDVSGYRAARAIGLENLYPTSAIQQHSLLQYFNMKSHMRNNIFNIFPWAMYDYKSSTKFQATHLNTQCDREKIASYFLNNKLDHKKTIILSPYEKTVSLLLLPVPGNKFWENLLWSLLHEAIAFVPIVPGMPQSPLLKVP